MPQGLPAEALVIEMDEVWSFVDSKGNPVWLWFALERSTRRILAWVVGDRSQETAFQLWGALPQSYEQRLRGRTGPGGAVLSKTTFCIDEWDAYNEALLGTRRLIGTAFITYVERFNNTLRQRLGRLVYKTLSFSKSLECLHASMPL